MLGLFRSLVVDLGQPFKMNSQALNLILPLFSLLSAVIVVLISSTSNIWQKKLDIEQKQEDRNQELSKLYIARKLEAGEVFVAGVVAIINQLDHLRVLVMTGAYAGEEDNQYYTKLQQAFHELRAATNATLSKERNASYLYFDTKVLEQQEDSEIPRIFLAEKNLSDLVADKQLIAKMLEDESVDGRSRDNVLWSYKENEKALNQALDDYGEAIVAHRADLIDLCGVIRKDLAKYDLATR